CSSWIVWITHKHEPHGLRGSSIHRIEIVFEVFVERNSMHERADGVRGAFEAFVSRMRGQDFSALWTVCHRRHAKDLTRTGAQNNLISREAFLLRDQLFELLVLSAGITASFVEGFGH